MSYLSKYAVARHIRVSLRKAGSNNHAVGADWTPAAGDVKVSIDGAAAGNVTNLPTAIAMGNSALWDFSLTSGELTGAQIYVTVADSATKAVEDDGFIIETYGNASAQHAVDLSDGVRAGLTALPNAAANATGGILAGIIRGGTAQSGSTSTTIKLDSGASATDNIYNFALVWIVSGTGVGQGGRLITAYVGSTKVATVDTWAVTPDNTSVFVIVPAGLDAISQAQVQSAAQAGCDASLNTAVPGSPTANSINERVQTLDDNYTIPRASYLDTLNGMVAQSGDVFTAINANRTEPGQAQPAANEDTLTKIDWLYKLSTNLGTQTATTLKWFNSDGVTVDQKATYSDDGTTLTKGRIVSGP